MWYWRRYDRFADCPVRLRGYSFEFLISYALCGDGVRGKEKKGKKGKEKSSVIGRGFVDAGFLGIDEIKGLILRLGV